MLSLSWLASAWRRSQSPVVVSCCGRGRCRKLNRFWERFSIVGSVPVLAWVDGVVVEFFAAIGIANVAILVGTDRALTRAELREDSAISARRIVKKWSE